MQWRLERGELEENDGSDVIWEVMLSMRMRASSTR
jgi:hypothetical protein